MTAGSTFHMDETGDDVFIEIDDLVLFFSHFFASIRPWGSFPEHVCHRSCHRFLLRHARFDRRRNRGSDTQFWRVCTSTRLHRMIAGSGPRIGRTCVFSACFATAGSCRPTRQTQASAQSPPALRPLPPEAPCRGHLTSVWTAGASLFSAAALAALPGIRTGARSLDPGNDADPFDRTGRPC